MHGYVMFVMSYLATVGTIVVSLIYARYTVCFLLCYVVYFSSKHRYFQSFDRVTLIK